MLHPIAPFVTESIWQALPHDGETIVTASWPDADEIPTDEIATSTYERLRAAVGRIRDVRSELGLAPRERLTLEVPATLDRELRALLEQHAGATCVERPSAAVVDDPLAAVGVRAPAGVLRGRYAKELVRLDGEVMRLERKLANEQFVGKASPEVVAKERRKLADYEAERALVRERLAAVQAEDQ
jgi:valyl-tRNA synthetase